MALNKRNEKGRPLSHAEMDANWAQIENWLAQKAASSHTHNINQITGLVAALSSKMESAQRGVANGVASLGNDGKVPLSQLPAIQASTGMYFPHDSLTISDIGKVAIWKDGKAQLPVFEMMNLRFPKYAYELNLSSFTTFASPIATITFSSNPVDGDMLGNYRFKTTPSTPNESQIYPTLPDTINALIETIRNKEGVAAAFLFDVDKVKIVSFSDGKQAGFSFQEDVLSQYVDTSFCTVSKTTTTAVDRLGHSLVPFLFLWSIGIFGDQDKDTAYQIFYTQNSSFSNEIMCGTTYPGNYPLTLDELKAGITEALEHHEDIYSHKWNDNVLTIKPIIPLSTAISVDSGDEDFWYNAFSDGTISDDDYLPVCHYSILGVIKSVGDMEVEIASEPIVNCMSSYNEDVVCNGQLDNNRIFILDANDPGKLYPFPKIAIENMSMIFMLIAPGYYITKDDLIAANSVFKGEKLNDFFSIQIFNMIFN
ncbi:MAG: hypothetical protein M9958_00520 [Chitinophagales bacterium]|nr:hypothetical protein [Chitinophagales bacterium]